MYVLSNTYNHMVILYCIHTTRNRNERLKIHYNVSWCDYEMEQKQQ